MWVKALKKRTALWWVGGCGQGPPAHSAVVCEARCLRNKCLLATLREISIQNKPVTAWAPAGRGLSHPRRVWPGRVDRSIVWKAWAHAGWDDTHWTRTGHASPHRVMEYLSVCEALLDLHTAKSFSSLFVSWFPAVAAGAKHCWGGANKLKVRAIWSKLLDLFSSSSERLVNGYFCKDKTECSFIWRYCACFHIN